MRPGTARHDHVRTGTGTVRRFIGGNRLTVIGLERSINAPLGKFQKSPELDGDKHVDGRTVFLTCEPELADDLLARYGVKKGTFTDMSGIIGAVFRYTETACGMLVKLDLLSN